MSPPELWNHLPLEMQYKVIELIYELEKLEDDVAMRDAMWAARCELEMWLNKPFE